MKKIILGLAVALASVSVVNQANASQQKYATATPAWLCSLQAEAVHDNRFFLILRAGEINAYGRMTCKAPLRKAVTKNVSVTIQQVGLGIGFSIPAQQNSINILQLKAGVATPDGMFGSYQLSAGPGLTLIGIRASAEAGAAYTPGEGGAAVLQITLENQIGLGIDLSSSYMTISPN